jgi:methanogenic corrinoid protein MtbC1
MTATTPEALARLLVGPSSAAVRGFIDAAVDQGIDPRTLCVGLITSALYEVGRLWQTGQITIAQEHLATAIAQVEIARLSPRMKRKPAVGKRAILAASPGELHTVGLEMLRHILEGDGWDVLDLGQATPAMDLARLVQDRCPDVVGLSTALTTHLEGALAGGFAYNGDESLARMLGADAYVPDAVAAANLLRERFGDG